MSGSTQVVKDFATPDRGTPVAATNLSPSEPAEEKKEVSHKEAASEGTKSKAPKPNTVTPPESVSRDDNVGGKIEVSAQSPLQIVVSSQVDSPEEQDKHVRFHSENEKREASAESPADSPASSNSSSQRGLVSRRGGRCASPGRIPSKPPSKEAILEFKTFRSPQRKRDENDTVPSLCSTSSNLDKEKKTVQATPSIKVEEAAPAKDAEHDQRSSPSKPIETDGDRKPLSISCDSSRVENTSPLSSHQADTSQDAKASQVKAATTRLDSAQARKTNVTFSPTPSAKDNAAERPIKTPTKSPPGGQFQSLPSLDDATLKSPVGIFLSPHPPTPSTYRSLNDIECFDKSDGAKQNIKQSENEDKRAEDDKSFPKSPKTREQERERFVATPTDFATDYGKGHPNSGSFDTSNVLAWLQSPTANGLFSPGGLGSIMNTPRGAPSLGGTGPRTPRTPTVSTSFFFSDVAGLPRSGEFTSPKPGSSDTGKRGGSQRGYSNIICISPLASSKSKNGSSHHGNTPINYKDVFASPAEKNPRSLPLLGDSPAKGVKARGPQRTASRDPSLDAVHMAERDLMEDEDLSVLLQLASNTPRSTGDRPAAVSSSDGTHVFRSPNARKTGGGDENLPALQLPIIGGREGEGNSARLSRKSHSRDHNEATNEFNAPSIGIRSTSSSGAKDMYLGKSKKVTPPSDDKTEAADKRKQATKNEIPKKSSKKSSVPPAAPVYSMPPPPYPHPSTDVPYYPPMPPGMPPGGSMRVVVGGPPPPRPPKSSSSPHKPGSPHAPRRYPMGPGDPNYPPPPYPPPPGHYPHHPGVHMQGVPPPPHPYHSHYPPPHHPPPRPHMPMYGAQHPPTGKSKTSKKSKQTKAMKAGTKRAGPSVSSRPGNGSAKKTKKSSPSAPKKKNKSPQLTDRGDRQKAAAAIQAVNAASGGKNDRAAALAAAILRGVTMRPSGKWQAQLYFAGKSRYIGVFDTREKAALAYEIAREKLKSEKSSAEGGGGLSAKATEAAVNSARKAAFEGVNERDPRLSAK